MINFVLYKMIQQGIIDESESIEYEYAIEVIFLKFIHIITIFSMAFLLNFLVPTLIFFLSFHYFRQYMGGFSCIRFFYNIGDYIYVLFK